MVNKKIRCAIYTRKSCEEGLEQDFNSLDAQREACESYIKSQMHEGWTLIPTHYDDGGYSGGTIDRPAFKRLLEDIKQDKIDIVVVYKVDRLTRSIMDFAKIISELELLYDDVFIFAIDSSTVFSSNFTRERNIFIFRKSTN